MAERKYYIGSVGPFLYEDTDLIDDPDGDFSGESMYALTTNHQLLVKEDPSRDEHIIRLKDIGDRISSPLEVSDIDDPSTELASRSGSSGSLLLVYQVRTNDNLSTLYKWDSANSEGANIPFVVEGSCGFWIAVAGKYSTNMLGEALLF